MAKPKKSMVGASGEIIENPIKANFKEGLNLFLNILYQLTELVMGSC